ncbi:MAG: hypothetical protein O7B99_06110, partial [Planctomycetota bacterium]|nr:hypothetical protein [Planctomycetota bacterium]
HFLGRLREGRAVSPDVHATTRQPVASDPPVLASPGARLPDGELERLRAELAARDEAVRELETELDSYRRMLEGIGELLPPTPPAYLWGDLYDEALAFFQPEGVFVDPIAVLRLLRRTADELQLASAPAVDDRGELVKEVVIDEPHAPHAGLMRVVRTNWTFYGLPAHGYEVEFFLPDESYEMPKFDRSRVSIIAKFHPDPKNPGYYDLDVSVRTGRLRDWGEDKMLRFNAGVEDGVYVVAELNGVMKDRDDHAYRTSFNYVEGFEEELARRYSPSSLHREIHGFCAFVESLF